MAAVEPLLTPMGLGAALDAALTAFDGFEPRPLLAVGVSGGPDSMALIILADRRARACGGTAWGLIVDHGLRPESTAEAAMVSGWLAARDIPHAVLTWEGEKPASGIQEAARAARYRLLAAWCVANGCLHLLTAHHRDDQVETYLIRRRAKSGADGLAGIAAVRELRGVRLVRPLLGVAKARLVAFLDAERQPYIIDPSNRNPAFERARLRLGLEAAPLPASATREGPAPPAWVGKGEQARILGQVRDHAAARMARERALAALLARAVSLHPAGFAVIDPVPLAAADEAGEQALGRVVAVFGGVDYPVRRERLRRLHAAIAEPSLHPRTLGGCRFVAWRGRVLALRETARAAPPLPLAPGTSVLWDRRFFATLPAVAPRPVTIGALGVAGVAALDRASVDAENPLPRLVYPALPAVWDAAGLAAVPHLGWRRASASLPTFVLQTAVPLFGAGFTVV